MMQRVVLAGFTRAAARRAAWSVLRALGAAALAGLGWRLGTEAYDAAKKRVSPAPPYDPEKTQER